MAVEIKELRKSFGDFSLSLDLRVEKGETLVLVGPSGCGKTTALNLIAGIIKPDGGQILIDGEDITGRPPHERNIAVVFQDLSLFPHLTVEQNVGYGLFVRGVPRKERQARAGRELSRVRLDGYGERNIHTLSGGERQRAAIARSLAVSPRALLLDEPFSSLDAPLRRELRREFAEIRRQEADGKQPPCIFVTHDREEAAVLGDRIALLAAGQIVEAGSAGELFLFPKTEFGARFFGFGQVMAVRVTGNRDGMVSVDCPLGNLALPASPELDERRPLIFIPRDAVSCPGKSPGSRPFRAVYRNSSFEGNRLMMEAELPGGTLLSIEGNIRDTLPEKGSIGEWELDESLLRFVRPSRLT